GAVEGFLLVAHPDVPVRSIDRVDLSAIFLKKVDQWADGTAVTLLEPLRESPTHETFAREVHGRSVRAIGAYWQRMIYAGQATPPEALEQHELLQRVASTPGAIGYVERDVVLPSGVITLDVEDYPDDVPLAAGAVGADAEPTAADAVVRGPAAQTFQSHLYDLAGEGSVLLYDIGPCDDGARLVVLANRGDSTVAVQLQVSRWFEGRRRSSATRRVVLRPGGEEDLGCSRRGREERRWAIAEVDVETSINGHGGRQGRSPVSAREAVGWVDGGSCGANGAGTVHSLRNRVLDRSVSVRVEIHQEVPGSSRTHVRSVTLGPGAEKRLGCSLDGKLRRTFTVKSASYR
ncbi:MAG: hypothetical protein AAGE94_26345, partial [Acidobacteriota bacterium]